MQKSATDGFQNRDQQVYNRAGKACSRCRTADQARNAGRRQPAALLVPRMPALRVGHKGADLIVPGNTLASFDAAVEAGVDMIEFDVLPVDGRLVLAHDYTCDLAAAPLLEDGLDHLAMTGIPLDVDLKLPGYEARGGGCTR